MSLGRLDEFITCNINVVTWFWVFHGTRVGRIGSLHGIQTYTWKPAGNKGIDDNTYNKPVKYIVRVKTVVNITPMICMYNVISNLVNILISNSSDWKKLWRILCLRYCSETLPKTLTFEAYIPTHLSTINKNIMSINNAICQMWWGY